MKKLTIAGLLAALLCVTPVTAFASDGENECRHERVVSGTEQVVVHKDHHTYTTATGTAECVITDYWGYYRVRCALCGEVLYSERRPDLDKTEHSVCGH